MHFYTRAQGIKTVFGIREEDEAAKPSPLSMYVQCMCIILDVLLSCALCLQWCYRSLPTFNGQKGMRCCPFCNIVIAIFVIVCQEYCKG